MARTAKNSTLAASVPLDDPANAPLIDFVLKAARAIQRTELAVSLLLWSVIATGGLLAAILVDQWLWPLSDVARYVLWVALLGGSTHWLIWRVLPQLGKRINPEFAAKKIESTLPDMKDGLISWLQLASRGSTISKGVLNAVGRQAFRHLRDQDAAQVIEQSVPIKLLSAAVGLVLAGAVYLAVSPKSGVSSLQRILMPWANIAPASRVQIVSLSPGNSVVTEGSNLRITIQVRGWHRTDQAWIRYSTDDGQIMDRSVPMKADLEGLSYVADLGDTFGGIVQPMHYSVHAGDAESGPFAIEVQAIPLVVIDRVEYSYPKYMRLKPQTVEGDGRVEGPEGTQIIVRAHTNQPAKRGRIEFDFKPTSNKPFQISKASDIQLDGQDIVAQHRLAIDDEGSNPTLENYRIRFENELGELNPDPVSYPIKIFPDLPPEVDFSDELPDQIDLPANQILNVKIIASDPDFGLSRIALKATLDDSKSATKELFHDEAGMIGRVLQSHAINPKSLNLKPGRRFELVAIAEDNRHVGSDERAEPNARSSRTLQVTVVAESETSKSVKNAQPNSNTASSDEANEKQSKAGPQSNQTTEPKTDEPNSSTPNTQSNTSETPKTNDQNGNSADNAASKNADNSADNQGNSKEPSASQPQPESSTDSSSNANASPSSEKDSSQSPKQSNDANQEGSNQSGSEDGQPSQQNQGGSEGQSSSNSSSPEGANGSKGSNQGSNGSNGSDKSNGDGASKSQGAKGNQGARGGEPVTKHDGEQFEKLQEWLEEDQSGSAEPSSARSSEASQEGASTKSKSHESSNPSSGSEKDSSGDQSSSDRSSSKSSAKSNQNNSLSKGAAGNKPSQSSDPGSKSPSQNELANQPTNPESRSNASNPSQREPDAGSNEKSQASGDGKAKQASREKGQSETPTASGSKENASKDATQKSSEAPQSESTNGEQETGASSSDPQSSGESARDPQLNQDGSRGSKNSDTVEAEIPSTSDQAPMNDANNASKDAQDSQSKNSSQEERSNPRSGDGKKSDSNSSSPRGKQGPVTGNKKGQPSTDGQPSSSESGSGTAETEGGSSDSRSRSKNAGNSKGSRPSDASSKEKSSDPVEPNEEKLAAEADYARQATDMVLKALQRQRNQPDPELLKRMGWTKEQMQEFVDRWSRARLESSRDAEKKREYDESLRSLGLFPNASRSRPAFESNDRVEGIGDEGLRVRPPEALREKYEAFQKARSSKF